MKKGICCCGDCYAGGTYQFVLSGVSYYEQELSYIDALIQAAKRRQESESRASHEVVAQINSIRAELIEIDSVISECSAKQIDNRNDSKKAKRDLQRELKCHHDKEKQLLKDLDRHFNQANKLSLHEGCSGFPTLKELYTKRDEIDKLLRVESSAEGLISGR